MYRIKVKREIDGEMVEHEELIARHRLLARLMVELHHPGQIVWLGIVRTETAS